MDWRDHVVSDPLILVGKPTLKGTRISVELVLSLFAGGWTREEVLENYPTLTPEMLQAAFAYAAEVLHDEAAQPRAV